ncbi:hypothetical protein [Pseudomonas oryziphila]|uniref:Uncharacterized protein n=1 Tax=Pseudomonas entomophila TaxID=312306 RepID=A0A3Q8U2L7_9PSED|nr:hypothetical protein [Pseudomonas oryziphila]AZL70063.1 hypothetical protein EJA05_21095 [Pseudomonas oryziphila]
MSKHAITEAAGITADEVLRIGKLYSSNELRGIQKKLTSTSGDLHKLANGWKMRSGLLGSLGDLLSHDQRELLRNAGQLIDSIGHNVTHAKEKRVRSEKDAKRRQDARLARSKQLVAVTYPLLAETKEQLLEILQAALILNRARQFYTSYSPHEFNLYLRNDLQVPERLYGISVEQYRSGNVRSLRHSLIDEVISHLAYDDGASVEDRLRLLQEEVANAVAQAPLTTEERETLHLWKEALLPNDGEGAAS